METHGMKFIPTATKIPINQGNTEKPKSRLLNALVNLFQKKQSLLIDLKNYGFLCIKMDFT